MKNNFFGKDLITVEGLTQADTEYLISCAENMKKLVSKKGGDRRLEGKLLAALFYEPSSRTFSSFITAMQRLGGGIIPLNGMSNTSSSKGESIEDTARVFSAYADALVIRHEIPGTPKKVADNSSVPVINAGDGPTGEHPSQALLDLFTIKEHFGKIEGLNIVMVGDLAHYRGVNSLSKILAVYPDIRINFIAPEILKIHDDLRKYLKDKKVDFSEGTDLGKIINEADVLNITRLKKEYLDEKVYQQLQGSYKVDMKTVSKMKKNSMIIHNLPRLWEVDPLVDSDPRALYFRTQVKNGLCMRMAILDQLLRNR
jgi:aspartate carbamoyltransferase catalytic subunit